MNHVLSRHVLTRAEDRGIPLSVIEDILANPAQIVDDESGEPEQKIYQSILPFAGKGD